MKPGWYYAAPYFQAHYFRDGKTALCGATLGDSDRLQSPKDRIKCANCQSRTGSK